MNKKQYLTSLIILAVLSVAALVTNYFFQYADWLIILLGIMIGYTIVKQRINGAVQYFSTRFNMLLDYDLDIDEALKMAQEAFDNAPTATHRAMYQMYLAMAFYYKGDYDQAIRTFNSIELSRLNVVFHSLVFSFTGYAAWELHDTEAFDSALSRLTASADKVPAKYQDFVGSYVEVLEAIQNMDSSIDHYKEVIDKHFSNDDGYLAKKMNYLYRLSYYYKAIGDTEEMDKCLAFLIANGKNQHLALRAKEMFTGSVNVEDFVWDPTKKEEPVDNVEPEVIEEASQEESQDDSEKKE